MAKDRFTDDFLREVIDSSDIVALIDQRVPLKKMGKDYAACCPFHAEKSPSFTVSPSKQFYHCFGCGAHGNVLGWLMNYDGLGFVEAVKAQAAAVGISLPEAEKASPEDSQRQAHEQRLYAVLAAANAHFVSSLRGDEACISYLKSRGVTGGTARRFELGFSARGVAGVCPGATTRELDDAGLILLEEGGEIKDRFRHRLMFPIHNERGQVIGFGGRTLREGGQPKYLNSPEGPLFDKGSELYGLHLAKQAIRQSRVVVVVEGYLDVCMLHQHGEDRAVAALGTSLTERNARKLLRLANEVVFCFDGDAAGIKAAARAAVVVLPELTDGKTVKFLTLADGHDPDSFVRACGIEAWRAALEQKAEPLSAVLVRSAQAGRDLAIPENKAAMARDMEPLLAAIVGAPIFRAALQRHVEDLLGIRLRVRHTQVTPGGETGTGLNQEQDRGMPGEVRPVPGRFIFYENLAALCGLDAQAAVDVPASQMDDFGTLIVSWFALAPDAGKARFESLRKVKSDPLRKVLLGAVERVEQTRRLYSESALQREVEGLARTIARGAEQEAHRAAAERLFGGKGEHG